ncbi:MAG: hypothetical protein LBT59_28175, partial [Clostridiales bacterium]|nr:hypothetical protein [Clostridiales bacterium]
QKTPLVLQGISTSMLIGLCVFANTTAFFRQTEPIQTPLASLLTCLFFVCLGSTVGIYSGSFLLAKRSAARIGLPVALAMLATIAMYFGEAVMMKDSLYRFGTGFFFDGLPAVSLAPADILVILLSGAIAWLVLAVSGKHAPGLKASLAAVLVSATIAISGAALASSPEVVDIFKVYRFSECLYMSPFSSLFMPPGKALPIVYSLREDSFLEFNTATGDIRSLQASFEKTPIRNSDFPSDILKSAPDISSYKKKYLVATLSDGQRLYQMDGEIWLVKVNEPYLWSIYLLEPTDSVSFEDLERSQAIQEEAFSTPDIREMTCKDLYALARKGKNLTLKDFEMFEYKLTGADLSVRLYHVEGGNTLTISGGEELGKIDLLSYRTQDGSKSIDLRDGFDEVASYLSPMNSLYDFTIEDEGAQAQGREELIYEYEYDECRYYLLNFDSSKLFAVFSSGERMPLKQAFEERRFVVEDVLARGYSMRIIPSSNPLGGEFTAHRNWVVFTLNKEKFYPSKSFMYLIDEGLVTYFDVSELADILSWYGYDEASKKLQDFAKSGATQSIARKSYIAEKDLASLDISVVIGWMISSHTPIEFIVSP